MRTNKSKEKIKVNLVVLLAEKYIDDITIVEICNKAKIDRKTFYKDYSNKEYVLNDIYDEFKEYLNSKIKSNNDILDVAYEMNKMFHLNYNPEVSNELIDLFRYSIYKYLMGKDNALTNRAKHNNSILLTKFITGAVVEVYNNYKDEQFMETKSKLFNMLEMIETEKK